jgi:hypothetical protein
LAYVWTGSTNAVQLRICATLICYAVLVTICQQVTQALGEPVERIAVEVVFCAFYHSSRAVQRGECGELVPFLVAHAKLLGIVKRWRVHYGERQQKAFVAHWLPYSRPTADSEVENNGVLVPCQAFLVQMPKKMCT